MLYWKKEANMRSCSVIPQVNCPDQSESPCLCHWWAQTVKPNCQHYEKDPYRDVYLTPRRSLALKSHRRWGVAGRKKCECEWELEEARHGREEKLPVQWFTVCDWISEIRQWSATLHFIFARHTLVTSWATNWWTDEMFSLPILTGINITNQIGK